jgi:hypothetical protein
MIRALNDVEQLLQQFLGAWIWLFANALVREKSSFFHCIQLMKYTFVAGIVLHSGHFGGCETGLVVIKSMYVCASGGRKGV